eukprot:8105716-Pyramimonas_sp.AAC.1
MQPALAGAKQGTPFGPRREGPSQSGCRELRWGQECRCPSSLSAHPSQRSRRSSQRAQFRRECAAI